MAANSAAVNCMCFAFGDSSLSRQFSRKFSPSDKNLSPYLSVIFIFADFFHIELDINFAFNEFLQAPIHEPKPLLNETLRADQFPARFNKPCSLIVQRVANSITI